MNDTRDFRIREIGQIKLTLRADLVFSPDGVGDSVEYLVEDPLNSKYYRLGIAEYAFISLLDGQTTINDALRLTATAMPDQALTENDAAAICKWLIEMNLAQTPESVGAARLSDAAEQTEQQMRWGRWNPIVFRRALFQPDRLLAAILPWLAWLYSPLGRGLWLVVVAVAGYHVGVDWDRFTASSRGVFAPNNWLWLGACWILMKTWHELGHGLVCRKYGGNVREIGVMFIMFAPLAYVDVTSTWKFRSKWPRIFTAAAGMYNELLVAAGAALIWSYTDAGVLNHVCYNLVIMSGLATLLFNANPLMRFDGYYMLTDFLEVPNLYSSGQQYLSYWARRHLLGVGAVLPPWSARRTALIRVYGVASLAWRLVVSACMIIAASTLFHGAGVVLACAAVVMWWGMPAFRFVRYLVFGGPAGAPNRIRFALTVGMGSVAVLTCFLLPWSAARRAPAIVEYAPLTIVRADSSGFIREIHVAGGQTVKQGDVLAVLENGELTTELKDLELTIKQSEIKSRAHHRKGRLAAYQAELETRRSLEKQAVEKRLQVASLVVRAPCRGVVIGRNLEDRLGMYVEQGGEIASLGDETQKELQISVSQDDVDLFATQVARPVRVRLPGSSVFFGTLVKLRPRANQHPPHPSFCAPVGGPLPAKAKDDSESDNTDDDELPYEFLEPRFSGTVALSPEQSNKVRAGQLGSVAVLDKTSIGGHLYRVVSVWIREKFKQHVASTVSPGDRSPPDSHVRRVAQFRVPSKGKLPSSPATWGDGEPTMQETIP